MRVDGYRQSACMGKGSRRMPDSTPGPTDAIQGSERSEPMGGEPPEVLGFLEATDSSFAEQALSFEVLSVEGAVFLRGSCPRCGDRMEFAHFARTYRGVGRWHRSARDRSSIVTVVCTCARDHPGRPTSQDGCGAYWNVILDPDER